MDHEILTPKVLGPRYGSFITILSIDGGGIRGMIPAVILESLESHLQVRTYDPREEPKINSSKILS